MDIKDIKSEEMQVVEMLEKAKTSPEEMQKFELNSLEILKKEINLILLKSTQNLYYIVRGHNIANARAIIQGDLVEPQNLQDYYQNLKILKKECETLKTVIDEVSGSTKIILGGDSSINKYKQARRDFEVIVSGLFDFVSQALYLTEQGEMKKGKAYLKTATHTMVNMFSSLKKLTNYVSIVDRQDKEYVQLFEDVQVFFESSLGVIVDFYEQFKTDEKKKKDSELAKNKIVDESKVFKSVPSQKDLERIEAINRTNDLYNRFQVDFMRDLQKEVSMMNRDMYEALIDKVEKFLKRFPMPLAQNVSIGMANEAYSQVSKFIDTVYEISRNTYTPVIFEK